MALTLTQTAQLTKKALLFSAILSLLVLVIFTGYKIYYYSYYLPHKPPPVIKPDAKFGKLPKPNFPQLPTTSSNYSYTIATVTGGLPTNIPKILKVYFIPQLGTTLLAADKAAALANSFSFTKGPDVSSQTRYQYSDESGGTMSVDLNTGNFKFSREATASANPHQSSLNNQSGVLDTQNKIVDDFKNLLSSNNLLNDDLKNGRSKVIYDSSDPSNSSTAQVSLWPGNFDNLEIETPGFNSSLVKSTVTRGQTPKDKYQSLDYTYWSPDSNNYSTYPLKTPEEALNDLKSGTGTIIVEPSSPQVAITGLKIAYYESDTYSPYLEPIYVFEGEGFVAYVSAILPDFLSN